MKRTRIPGSRRAFVKMAAFGLSALGASASASRSPSGLGPVRTGAERDAKPPGSDIRVWFTNGKQRFAAGAPISWQAASLFIGCHARTQEIIRSGQYWALAHFSRAIRRGAQRFESQSVAADLGHIAFENPSSEKVLVRTNLGAARTIQLNQGPSSASVSVEENSIATLVWK